MTNEIIRWAGAGIVIIMELVLLANLLMNKDSPLQRLIKNVSAQEKIRDASYSYSRTQLVWWTFIVITCALVDYGITGTLNGIMSSTALTLIGIGAGTSVAGRVIDNSQANDPSINQHQHKASQGFWMDILSDKQGVSIHRFQSVLFNVGFGFAFITQFMGNMQDYIKLDAIASKTAEQIAKMMEYLQLPDFDSTTLGLIGISSATYVTLKFNENLSKKPTPTPAPAPPPAPDPAPDPGPDPDPNA